LRTAWTKVRDKAKVVGRWHDNRHTLVTELSESGARRRSHHEHRRARLARHALALLPRPALDEIATRQNAADEKRKADAERRELAAAVSQTVVVQ
jgi:hypothetical protein